MRRPLAVVNVHGVRLPGAASRSVVNGLTKIGRFLLFQGKAEAVFGEIVFRLLHGACVGEAGKRAGGWPHTAVGVLCMSRLPRGRQGASGQPSCAPSVACLSPLAGRGALPGGQTFACFAAPRCGWQGGARMLRGIGRSLSHGVRSPVCRSIYKRCRRRGVSCGLSLWQWHGDKRWEAWVWHGFRKKYVACLQRQAESEQQT